MEITNWAVFENSGSHYITPSRSVFMTDQNNYGETSFIPNVSDCSNLGTEDYVFYQVHTLYLYVQGQLVTSDKRKKENFEDIDTALDKIKQLKGQKYDFIDNTNGSIKNNEKQAEYDKLRKNKLGFIAQDVQNVLPEAVYYDEKHDQYYLDYNAFIPVIIEALKEQQTQIDELKAELANLKSGKEKSATLGNEETSVQAQAATLNQNIPNPFSETTCINLYLPLTVNKAQLYIYNMQGNQVNSFPIIERENTSVTIEGHSLKAGMYLYTLIADGKEVDTKKMILTE